MENKPIIYLFTDGAASGNPGPGGWGAVLKCNGHEKRLSGGFRMTTNNRMELLAVIKGLEAVKWDMAQVHIYSDSAYVVNAINKGWLLNWERKSFDKVKNTDLWKKFLGLYKRHRLSFIWIKGHDGHPENELCDALAVEARTRPLEGGGELPADFWYEEYGQSL